MKKKVLLSVLFTMLCASAYATVTVEQTTNPEFVINSGYSEATAESIEIAKQRANGQPAEPLYNKKQNKLVKFWRYFYGYIDPAVDTNERIHHDIHMSPSWKDL